MCVCLCEGGVCVLCVLCEGGVCVLCVLCVCMCASLRTVICVCACVGVVNECVRVCVRICGTKLLSLIGLGF